MFALWREPEVCRHAGPATDVRGDAITLPARSRADSDAIIEFFIAHAHAGLGFRWAMMQRRDGAFIGALGFNSLGRPPAPGCPEIAFHLHPLHWRRGYMREACEAALAWAQAALACTHIEAWADDANSASVRLLARLGFTASPTLRDGARQHVLTMAHPAP